MIEDSLLKDSLKTCQNQPETQIYYELFKGLNICIPKEPLEQTKKEEWSSQRMGKNSPMPHFLHTTITVYSKDKMPNLSHAAFRSHIARDVQQKKNQNNGTQH